jgi:hypothetical protein
MGVYLRAHGLIGLTFTLTTIFASWYTASKTFEVEKHDTSLEFKKYYHETVRDCHPGPISYAGLPDEDRVERIFREAIAPLTKKLTDRLGHAPDYRTLFLPSVFGKRVGLVSRNALLPDHAIIDGSHNKAMCSAWRFYQGENLGREPHECNDSGPRNVILVLEYNYDYLFACTNQLD